MGWFANFFGLNKSDKLDTDPCKIMLQELRDAVGTLDTLIHKYNLSRDAPTIVTDEENGWKKEGYWYLLFALHGLDKLMDPDYAWYDRKVHFDNGYGASIICKPFSYGGDEKHFEIAVLKFGEICYDTPVSYDVEGYLDFEDVLELLHEIHDLPSAEEDDAEVYDPMGQFDKMSKRIEEDEKNGRGPRRDKRYEKYEASKANYREWVQRYKKYKASQEPAQKEANPYEVPTGPT